MLYTLLANASESHPDKLAVVCGKIRYNYAQLKERVDKLAGAFHSVGIQKEDKIAVIYKNCHRFLEVYFAAAKIGAVLVPLNYRLSSQDFIFILNDSQAKVLIAQPRFAASIIDRREDLPMLESMIITEAFADQRKDLEVFEYEHILKRDNSGEDLSSEIQEEDIAQIYYTSGTTGRPKGVILTHRNNWLHAEGTIQELDLRSSDNWLHVSPMFHLADAWAVWSITKVGATHVMIPCFEPKQVLEAIQDHRVTLSNFIPTMLNILVNTPDVDSYDLSSLRLILSGGAPIAKEVVRKVVEIFGCDYIQTYGLTETSPFLTMSILSDEMKDLPFEERLRYVVTTGRPFSDVELKVLREDGREVLPDEKDVGEIVAKGETITPGYWNLPRETTKRIKDGWLHTHDLAVINPEGYITIVDRKDDMIITGGEKVYSVEVENALYSHPSILEAAVIGLRDPIWGECVTAVVVPKAGHRLSENEVISFCREKLARFKSPKRVIFSRQLPKTGSSKIYKYRLRKKYGKE
jgi:acyl-CoA synthetase (AMP-forming)/AMP-acid ligase II